MHIKHLEYIIEVHKCGSVNKAAQNCYISQSHLSTIIKKFEYELGFSLLNRSSRGVSFTKGGMLFIQSAEKIVQECENMKGIGRNLESPQNLNIICSLSSFLVQCFFEFETRKESANKNDVLLEGGLREVLKSVIAQSVRLGIMVMFSCQVEKYTRAAAKYDLGLEVLMDNIPVVAVMSQRHPLAHQEVIRLEDLRQHAFVVDANVDYDDTLAVLQVTQLQNVLSVSGRSSWFDAIRKGNYLSTVMKLPESDIKAYNLVCRPIADLEENMTVLLLKGKTKPLTKREERFIQFLKQRMGQYYRPQIVRRESTVPS